MAEISEKPQKGEGKRVRQKKMPVHIDFTPMVDMNMLLITFFMLCTSLIKPQTMELSMPSKDKVTDEEQTKVKESAAITLLLAADNKIYYYTGMPNYEDYTSLSETTYSPDGLRAFLTERNRSVADRMKELERKRADLSLTEEEYKKQASEIKNDPDAPVVMIKPLDVSNYKNMVDALDEMHLSYIGKYAIVDVTDGDKFLIQNYTSQGALSKEIDHSKMVHKK